MVASTQSNVADLILINGKVWTVNPQMPWAEAVAIKGERIVFVGSNSEAMGFYHANQTKLLDVKDKLVLPGFNDSHVHFINAGEFFAGVELQDVHNEEEFINRLKQSVARLPEGEWITGGYWGAYEHWNADYTNPLKKKVSSFVPHKDIIDPYTKKHPVLLYKYDKSIALANSKALELAGINGNGIAPYGGTFIKSAKNGKLTGLLHGTAIDLVKNIIPLPSFERKLLEAKIVLQKLRENGITTIQDITLPEDIKTYQKLLENNELTVRVLMRPPVENWQDYTNNRFQNNNEMLKIIGFKGYADGMVGNCTALLSEPYLTNQTNYGIDKLDSNLQRLVWEIVDKGFTPHLHAIGDQAIRNILNLYEKIIVKKNLQDHRFRIIHAQIVHRDDFKRFGELGITAEINPYHCIDDMRWMEERIGCKRSKCTYAFRSLKNNGALLCFGSDSPGTPYSRYSVNPMHGIHAATTRQTFSGFPKNSWFAGQKLSIEQAVEAYTINPAIACFEEKMKGTIKEGKLADLIVLPKDIFQTDLKQIYKIKASYTILNGKIVFAKDRCSESPH